MIHNVNHIVPIIKRKLFFYNVLLIIWIMGLCSGVLSVIFSGHKIFFYFIIGFIISFLIWIVGNIFVKKYSIIGELDFISDRVLIKEINNIKEFNISDISQLSITYYGKKGDSFGVRYGLFRIKDGANNFISFSYKGNNYSYQFLVLTSHFTNSLRAVIRSWLMLNSSLKLTVFNEYKENITNKFV